MMEPLDNPELDTSLLPIYQFYNSYQTVDTDLPLWNYLRQRVDPEQAATFCKVIWPDFIEVEGCIILAEHYNPDNFRYWQDTLQGDKLRIEGMLNHVHIYDLFNNEPDVPENWPYPTFELPLYEYIAHVLINCWKCALASRFPDRSFEFSFGTEPEEYGPTISFWHTD